MNWCAPSILQDMCADAWRRQRLNPHGYRAD